MKFLNDDIAFEGKERKVVEKISEREREKMLEEDRMDGKIVMRAEKNEKT